MEQVAVCYFVVSDGMAAIDFEVFGLLFHRGHAKHGTETLLSRSSVVPI